MSSASKTQWRLEEIAEGGRNYLLDKETAQIYQASLATIWPQLVGKLINNEVQVSKPPPSLYTALDNYLKDSKQRLKELFDEFDDDGSGTLDGPELTRLVKRLLPDTGEGELRYFRILLDPSGEGMITYPEFHDTIKDCVSTESSLRTQSTKMDVAPGIERISQVVQADSQVMHKLYKGFSSAGSLAPEALSRLLYDCVPNIETKELRHLLMYLKQIDLAGESKSTFKEVLQALRLLAVQRVPGSVPNPEESREKRENTSTSGAPAEKQQWTLERHAFEGKAYLLDRARGKVYSQESTVTWPRLVGQFSSNKVVLQEPPPDLISALDNYLRSNGMRLKEVFDDFDDDNSGTLDRHELVNLVRKVLPHAHAGELSYFQVILDVNGDGRVTYQELIKTIKDCLAIGKTLCEKQSLEVDASLEQASKRILENQVSRQRVLKEFERDGSRGLLPRDVAQLVREILPSFADSNMRHLLLSLKSLDLDGSGRVQSADFMQTLRLVDIRLTESAKAEPPESAATKSVKPSEQWELEEMYFEGKLYLVDRTERKVYSASSPGDWPRLVGRLVRGNQVELTKPPPDLFKALDSYLRSNQKRLRDVFDEFDDDNSGALDGRELARMVKKLLPDVHAGELRYFQVVLDTDGNGNVSFSELIEVIKECMALGKTLQGSSGVGMSEVLEKMKAFMLTEHVALQRIFREFDKDGTGQLSAREMAKMVKAVMPALTSREIRHLMMSMKAMDLDGDGQVSMYELKRALRMVDVQRIKGGSQSPSKVESPVQSRGGPTPAAAQTPAVTEQWELEENYFEGKLYLVDRTERKVYSASSPGDWPRLVGRLVRGNQVELTKPPPDLFKALDSYLRSNQKRLRDVFDEFDDDNSGALDGRELARMVKKLLPDVHAGELRYFQVVLDTDGNGNVSFSELIEVIKECMALGKTLQGSSGVGMSEVLEKVKVFMLTEHVALQRIFREFDKDGTGQLSAREMAKMVKAVMPALTSREIRHLMMSMKAMDLDGDGQVSMYELKRALRMVDVQRIKGGSQSPSKVESPVQSRGGPTPAAAQALVTVSRDEPIPRVQASPPPRLSVKTEAPKPVGEWVLQSMQYDGKAYLLDPTSKKVYFEAQESEWPRLAGHFKDGKVVLITHTPDLFESLDRYLKTNQTRLKDVFNEFDTDNSGELDVRELEKLLKRLLSDITPAQIRYFTVMLDVDGDGKVTYAELTEGIRDCYASGQSLEARDTVTADDVLMKLAHHVQENHQSVKSIFDQADKHNTGLLNQNELAGLMKKVMPGLSKREQRALIRQMSSFDVDGDGRWSFRELLQALRLVRTRVQEGGTPVATPSTPMQAAKEEWLLEEISYGGVNYLIDRVSGKVYHDTPDAQWPELAGHFTKGSLVLLPKTLDLFQSLDIYLKEHQTRLQDVFNKFDLDKNGTLDPREMSLFLKELMPEASNKQVRYFQLMFDLDGDGGITLEELQGVLRECIRAGGKMVAQTELSPEDVLKKLAEFLSQNKVSAEKLFKAYDKDHSGSLGSAELARLVRQLLPSLSSTEVRNLLVRLRELDRNGDGEVSFHELKQGLRLLKVKRHRQGEARTELKPAPLKPAPVISTPPPPMASVSTLASSSNPVATPTASELSRTSLPLSPGPAKEEWVLEEFVHQGRQYLIDRRTSRVFYDTWQEEWPQLAGQMLDGQVNPVKQMSLIFSTLDSYLKTQRRHLKHVFDDLDLDRNGSLSIRELAPLLRRLLPDISVADIEYFQVMVDVNGDGQVTHNELLASIKECHTNGDQAASHVANQLASAVNRVKSEMQTYNLTLHRAFKELDVHRTGALELPVVLRLLQRLAPTVTPKELRHLLAAVRQYSAPATNTRYEDLQQVLRQPIIKRVRFDSKKPLWMLAERVYSGSIYLVDTETSQVYHHARDDEWPQLVGKLAGSTVQVIPSAPDLFGKLEEFMGVHKLCLREVFSQFDKDRNGQLDAMELNRMVKRLEPRVKRGTFLFFLQMLDANTDKRVSLAEFLAAFRDCVDLRPNWRRAVPENLRQLSQAVESRQQAVMTFFQRNAKGSMRLDVKDAYRAVKVAQPKLSQAEWRHLLVNLRPLDLHQDGKVGYQELLQVLRLVSVQPMGPVHANPEELEPWTLEEVKRDGRNFLWDQATGRVYTVDNTDGWPISIGQMVSGRIVAKRAPDLFTELEKFIIIKADYSRLVEIFGQVDRDGDGGFNRMELVRLLRRLAPTATDAEFKYLHTMLDPAAEGHLTKNDIIDAIRACARAEERMRSHTARASIAHVLDFAAENASVLARLAYEHATGIPGHVPIPAVLLIFRQLMPGIAADDLRNLLALLWLSTFEQMPDVTVMDMKQVLRLVRVQRHRLEARSPSPKRPETTVWELEMVVHDDRKYLLDRTTGKLYHDTKDEGDWPQLAGKLVGGQLRLTSPPPDLFTALDDYLKVHRQRLREVFSEFDRDGSKNLDADELGLLIQRLLPSVTGDQMRYFQAMLSVDGGGKLTYEELISVIKECRAIGSDVRARSRSDLHGVLGKLAGFVQENRTAVNRLFRKYDLGSSGKLPLASMGQMVRELMVGISPRDMRQLLNDLSVLDADGDGLVSMRELEQVLRLVNIRKTMPQDSKALPPAPSTPVEWALEEELIAGKIYLVDRSTSKVYSDVGPKGWPALVGKLVQGQLVRRVAHGASNADLFAALDQYLKENSRRLRDLFDEFAVRSHGKLDKATLATFVQRLIPAVTPSQVRYFQIVMDLDGDGQVSYEEIIAVIREHMKSPPEGNAASEEVLVKLSAHVQRAQISVQEVFTRHDRDRSGRLEAGELPRLLQRLMPGLTPQDTRTLLAHLHALDTDGDGTLSLQELASGLRLAQFRRRPLRAAAVSAPGLEVWSLEALEHDGSTLLVDRTTGSVYQEGRSGEWPQLVGRLEGARLSGTRLEGGHVVEQKRRPELFSALDTYLKTNEQSLSDVFARFDDDRSGALDANELPGLLRALMPGTTSAEMAHFQVMLDINGDGKVTLEELKSVLRDIMKMKKSQDGSGAAAMGSPCSASAPPALRVFREIFQADLRAMRRVFRQHDKDGAGFVTRRGLIQVTKEVMQSSPTKAVTNAELIQTLRSLLMQLFELQHVEESGKTTFHHLLQAMRLLHVKHTFPATQAPPAVPHRGQPAAKVGAPADRQAPAVSSADDWELEELSFKGQNLLVDRATNKVYFDCRDNEWPQLAGQLVDGTVQLRHQVEDVFDSLDRYLKANKQKLREVFDDYDRDRNGSLSEGELTSMLKQLLPDVSPPQAAFFWSMFDVDGDGRVTYNELVDVLKECRTTGASMRTRADSTKVADGLSDLAAAFRERREEAVRLFSKYDTRRSGTISFKDTLCLAREIVPSISTAELRTMLIHMNEIDVSSSSHITLPELLQVLHLSRPRRRASINGGGGPPAQARSSTASTTASRIGAVGAQPRYGSPLRHSSRSRSPTSDHSPERQRDDAQRDDAQRYLAEPGTPPPALTAIGGADTEGGARRRQDPEETGRTRGMGRSRNLNSSPERDRLPAAMDEWVLHEAVHSGLDRVFLVDKLTGKVYHDVRGEEWPRLAGWLLGEQIHLIGTGRSPDIFDKLEEYVRLKRSRLREVFDEYDADASGSLDSAELARLLIKILPDCTAYQLRHFQGMLDMDGDGKVSYEEFVTGVRECHHVSSDVADGSHQDGGRVLEGLRRLVQANHGLLRQLFHEADYDGDGGLDMVGVAQFMRELVPNISRQHLRYLLAELAAADLDGDGSTTLTELLQVLRLVRVSRVPLGFGKAKPAKDWMQRSFSVSPSSKAGRDQRGRSPGPRSRHDVESSRMVPVTPRGLFGTPKRAASPAATPSLSPSRRARPPPFRASAFEGEDLADEDERSPSPSPRRMRNYAKPRVAAASQRVSPGSSSLNASAVDMRRSVTRDGSDPFFPALNHQLVDEWVLEELPYKGVQYLADRTTGKVYLMQRAHEWPHIVGRLVGGRVEFIPKADDIFQELRKFMHEHRKQMHKAFASFDRDQSGLLDIAELGHFVKTLAPKATPRQIKFVQAMLDADSDGHVSYKEFTESVEECSRLGAEAGGPQGATGAVPKPLKTVSQFFLDNLGDTRRIFEQFDLDGSGALDQKELRHMVKRTFPLISRQETRSLLAALDRVDVDGDGKVSYNELMQALRLLKIVVVPCKATSVEVQDYDELPAAPEWVLEDFFDRGRAFLFDRRTGKAYYDSGDSAWPQLAGRVVQGQVFFSREVFDIFAALEDFYRGNRRRLKELFDDFDTDRSQAMESRELAHLARHILREAVTEADLEFFTAMLDADQEPAISYDEFTFAIGDCTLHARAAREEGSGMMEPGGLSRLASAFKRQLQKAEGCYRALCMPGGAGRMELSKLGALVREVFPKTSVTELRALMASVHQLDLDGDSTCTLEEILQALRVVAVRRVGPGMAAPPAHLHASASARLPEEPTGSRGQASRSSRSRSGERGRSRESVHWEDEEERALRRGPSREFARMSLHELGPTVRRSGVVVDDPYGPNAKALRSLNGDIYEVSGQAAGLGGGGRAPRSPRRRQSPPSSESDTEEEDSRTYPWQRASSRAVRASARQVSARQASARHGSQRLSLSTNLPRRPPVGTRAQLSPSRSRSRSSDDRASPRASTRRERRSRQSLSPQTHRARPHDWSSMLNESVHQNKYRSLRVDIPDSDGGSQSSDNEAWSGRSRSGSPSPHSKVRVSAALQRKWEDDERAIRQSRQGSYQPLYDTENQPVANHGGDLRRSRGSPRSPGARVAVLQPARLGYDELNREDPSETMALSLIDSVVRSSTRNYPTGTPMQAQESRTQFARWYMDLVEVGVPRMEYVKGALLLVPDALSRQPDYSAKTPREGLKEAGIFDAKSDLPKDPLSVLDTSDLFEEGPALGTLTQLAEVNSWLDAVDTLQLAELAMESQLGAKELRAPHHCEDLPIEVAAGAGGVQTQHPGADLPTEVTSDAGRVQMQHPGADLPTEVTSDAGGVQMQRPGADLPTEVTSDAGGVQMQHPGADLPTEVTPDAGGVQTEHPGADHLTEVTVPPTRGATLAFQRASLKKSARALRGAFKSLRAKGRSKLPGKAALEMPAEASEQPCGVVASRTRSKTGLPPAGGTSGCQAPIAPAQTPPQVSAKVPMERPSGTVTSRSRSNTKSPPQQEAVKPATPPTVVLTDAPKTRKPPAKSASQSRREATGRFHQALFERLQSKYGKFDVDACCGPKGRGQLVDKYWENCLKEQWRGLHVLCSPPHDSDHLTIEAVLRTYVHEWRQDPENTSAVFLLPDLQSRMPQWRKLFRRAGMRIEEVIPTHDSQGNPTQLFKGTDGVLQDLPWPMLVVYAPPSRSRPQRIRHQRVPPPIVDAGKASKMRDAQGTVSAGGDFLEALRDEYSREPSGPLRTLREQVQSAPHHSTKHFRIVGEVLWRVAAGHYQLVLGEGSPLREIVFREAHDSLAAGHTGRDTTLERVLRRFWWKNASDDVGAWVASCPTCQAVKTRSSYPDGLLNPHSIPPSRNWQDVGVDFVTGLPLTEQGNDAFVAFTCKLSKMVHVVPINFGDSSAATIARIYFDTVWRQHGAPMKIVSDRDPRFQDAFWKELMRLMGVKDMLRSFVDDNPEDWDLYATNVEFAINDSRSDVTGFTPFELCYGVSPMSQLDMFLEAAQSTDGRRKGGVGTAHEWAFRFSSQLRDARGRLELAQQRQRDLFDQRHGQREYAVGDLVWVEAKHLTEKLMDRSLCRKLSKRWHGPLAVTERFYSDMQAGLPEADRGAPVAYRLQLPPRWRIRDVFAQHRLKPYVGGADAFASRRQPAIPEAVIVDGQREAHVDRILARRVRISRGKEIVELKQLKDFETERLAMEGQVRDAALRRREQRRDTPSFAAVASGASLAYLLARPWEEEFENPTDECLPWEQRGMTREGEVTYVTTLAALDTRPVRILVLFSGTGSVEKEFARCFPASRSVTLDADPLWRPTHVTAIESWDYWRYPPGYFDVVWASPPCTQYSQARTTGGPPDFVTADACVQRTLDIIEYLRPQHWFVENPMGRYPDALRFRPVMSHLPAPLTCTYCMKVNDVTVITLGPSATDLRQAVFRLAAGSSWEGLRLDKQQVTPNLILLKDIRSCVLSPINFHGRQEYSRCCILLEVRPGLRFQQLFLVAPSVEEAQDFVDELAAARAGKSPMAYKFRQSRAEPEREYPAARRSRQTAPTGGGPLAYPYPEGVLSPVSSHPPDRWNLRASQEGVVWGTADLHGSAEASRSAHSVPRLNMSHTRAEAARTIQQAYEDDDNDTDRWAQSPLPATTQQHHFEPTAPSLSPKNVQASSAGQEYWEVPAPGSEPRPTQDVPAQSPSKRQAPTVIEMEAENRRLWDRVVSLEMNERHLQANQRVLEKENDQLKGQLAEGAQRDSKMELEMEQEPSRRQLHQHPHDLGRTEVGLEPPSRVGLMDNTLVVLPEAATKLNSLAPNLEDKGAPKRLWCGRIWQLRAVDLARYRRLRGSVGGTAGRAPQGPQAQQVDERNVPQIQAIWRGQNERNSLRVLERYGSLYTLRGVVIYMHGTEGMVREHMRYARMLAAMGFLVLAPSAATGSTSNSRHQSGPLTNTSRAEYWSANALSLEVPSGGVGVLADPGRPSDHYGAYHRRREAELAYMLQVLPAALKSLGVFIMGASEGAATVAHFDDTRMEGLIRGRIICSFGVEPSCFTPLDYGAAIRGSCQVPTLNVIGSNDEYFAGGRSVAQAVTNQSGVDAAIEGNALTAMQRRRLERGLVCVLEGALHDLTVTHDNWMRDLLAHFLHHPGDCHAAGRLWACRSPLVTACREEFATEGVSMLMVGGTTFPAVMTIYEGTELFKTKHGRRRAEDLQMEQRRREGAERETAQSRYEDALLALRHGSSGTGFASPIESDIRGTFGGSPSPQGASSVPSDSKYRELEEALQRTRLENDELRQSLEQFETPAREQRDNFVEPEDMRSLAQENPLLVYALSSLKRDSTGRISHESLLDIKQLMYACDSPPSSSNTRSRVGAEDINEEMTWNVDVLQREPSSRQISLRRSSAWR
ncbi:hypothetical protein CYMTET_48379 [Cymbomonas tetramitiformis]|uniref:EF-hand domain-containing protein n=1 Tax=Cymbomonas tetramitiformis TaxID=36881 RepID=A0AAE0EV21_9CHLO|nr:hypothetical protein CYMTET_48379 [Cymbomonas tetramitiformis]